MMQTYIAMLRGINVGGHHRVKMDQLRESFEALGFTQVQTYIQSGNVIFLAPSKSPADLCKRIAARLLQDFGFPVPVTCRTPEQLRKAIQDNPLLKKPACDPSKLHVTFLSQAPSKAALKEVEAWSTEPDVFSCSGAEVYLYCPNGYHATKLSNNALEKALSAGATTRNWKTVNGLYEMAVQGR
jgi:uncharacterized protein (DUF1697 family)